LTAVASDTTTGDTPRSPLEHRPALDGLRGACLGAVRRLPAARRFRPVLRRGGTRMLAAICALRWRRA
jgi:hypothetical protein